MFSALSCPQGDAVRETTWRWQHPGDSERSQTSWLDYFHRLKPQLEAERGLQSCDVYMKANDPEEIRASIARWEAQEKETTRGGRRRRESGTTDVGCRPERPCRCGRVLDQIMDESSKPDWRKTGLHVVERDEQGRAHICIQCMRAVKPWGPCYQMGHEAAPIQNNPQFIHAN